MHLIEPLAAGVTGAGAGLARIYKRGTSTPAPYYTDAEASGPPLTSPIALDSNGGAAVYVAEYVDVHVESHDGTHIRSFTEMASDAAVEVRSPSFTGTEYTSSAVAAEGGPVDLSTVLDRAKTSFGAADWMALMDGEARTLQALLAALFGGMVNVKDPKYGATGDGTTDDYGAISAAILDANTKDRPLFFPPGVYKASTSLLFGLTDWVGTGQSLSVIDSDLAAGAPFLDLLGSSARPSIRDLELRNSGNSSTAMISCSLGPSWQFDRVKLRGGTSAPVIEASGGGQIAISNSRILHSAPGASMLYTNGVDGVTLTATTLQLSSIAYTPANGMLYGNGYRVTGCHFDYTLLASGTFACWERGALGGAVETVFAGNVFADVPSLTTVTAFDLAALSVSTVFVEAGNAVPFETNSFKLFSYTTNTSAHVFSDTRAKRSDAWTDLTNGTFNVTTEALNLGNLYITNTSTGAVTYNFTMPPQGNDLYVTVQATAGITLTVQVNGVAIKGGGAATAIAAGNRSTFHIRMMSTDGATMISENLDY